MCGLFCRQPAVVDGRSRLLQSAPFVEGAGVQGGESDLFDESRDRFFRTRVVPCDEDRASFL